MAKKLVILGAGESGMGAALLGKKAHFEVLVSEYGQIHESAKRILDRESVPYEERGHSDKVLEADVVVKSPGIPDNAPVVAQLLLMGREVISEIEFAFRHMKGEKVVAITGTNGKTTTALLTHHLLRTAGYRVALGGNVGVSLARLAAHGGYDYYVVEVSSFQLDGIARFKPDVAVLLNITPDHLDRYDNDFQRYVRSKFRITENLTKEDCFIYCADSAPVKTELAHRKITSSLLAVSVASAPGANAYPDQEHLVFDYQFKGQKKHYKIPLTDIPLMGKHNMVNAMSAILSALNMEVPIRKIVEGLKSFINAPHRLEMVREIEGVRYINDSKATNTDAVYHAMEGINTQIIWLAGGIDKGNGYTGMQALVKAKVKHLITIGVRDRALIQAFASMVPITKAASMHEAVAQAAEAASSGDVVLLSPACASFDRYKSYEDRGNRFKVAVNKIFTQKVKP